MTQNLENKRLVECNSGRMALFLKSAIFTALFLSESVIARTLSLVSYENPPDLGSRQGYVLVKLDVDGTAPSIEFFKLYSNGSTYLESGKKTRLRKNNRYHISLKGKPSGYYLMAIPSGLYQITQINAPYFNLPYKLDTSSRRTWRFHVEAEKTNYIGSLFIGKQRKSDSIEVYLKNRIATDFNEIQASLGSLTELYPLVSGTGVQDVFFNSWQGPLEVEQ
ncbi:hypothetical protein P3339_08700 [Microbulbifer sp. MLAF003]|uniref:hypothetical protein n=1 Tax=Microbulbifer TaxID=48073 RepID=UPI0012F842F5|nr:MULTISPECIES: hypothetical protein [Microbulbifer]WHI52824.1 hypothetical protein P3339_08700 [Microbulbifer sp. MLAF003]